MANTTKGPASARAKEETSERTEETQNVTTEEVADELEEEEREEEEAVAAAPGQGEGGVIELVVRACGDRQPLSRRPAAQLFYLGGEVAAVSTRLLHQSFAER